MEKKTDENMKIFSTIDKNFNYLNDLFGEGIGLIKNKNEIFENGMQIGLVYIDSMTDKMIIRDHVLLPILSYSDGQCKNENAEFFSLSKSGDEFNKSPDDVLLFIQSRVISATNTQITSDMDQVVERILSGCTVLFIEKAKSALIIGSRKAEKKAVESPENEATVLGSQESFTDDLSTNMSLMIKRLPAQGLHFEEFTVGTRSRTKIKLVWLDDIADPRIIDEARCRIDNIDIDNVDGIGMLAGLIEDKPMSLFPKYRQTERPDVATRNLTDGRFIILCDHSPFAFIAPVMIWDNFRTMDDYDERSPTSSYLRIVRYISFMLSISISALYLAFVTYNQAIVPPSLALSIAAGRETVPMPSVVELLLLTFSISIIREAGLRMPKSVSYFVGTLAAVVIGQAIVTAGYVSPSLIIVVAISTISTFAISSTTLVYPSRLLNYFLILMAGFFGIFGVINGFVIIFWNLASLSSFGVPYLYPVLPFDKEGFKDVFVRSPFTMLNKRMKRLSPKNRVSVGKKEKK